MRPNISKKAWCLASLYLLGIFCQLCLGSPTINAYLTSSFKAPPFINIFLETVSGYDGAYFFELLDILSNIRNTTWEELNLDNYNYLFKIVSDNGIIRDNVSLSFLNYELALQLSAPKIESYYHYYNYSVVPEMINKSFIQECANWVLFNGQQYCNIHEFSRELDSRHEEIESAVLLPFDHVFDTHKDFDSPVAVLYADLGSDDYKSFHSFLFTHAKAGKLKYVFRYKPGSSGSNSLYLNGYGVQVSLKKTDYLVIDDRNIVDDLNQEIFFENHTINIDSDDLSLDIQNDEIKPLTNAELKKLGLSIVQFVTHSKTPLETLNSVLQDLPKYASYLSSIKVSTNLTEKLQLIYKYISPGMMSFSINGFEVDPSKINGFSLLNYLRNEYDFVMSLQKLGLSAKEAKLFLNQSIHNTFNKFSDNRFDFRDKYEDSMAILWLNDIEKDSTYSHLSNNIYKYFDDIPLQQLHMVRRNLHHIIVFLDFSAGVDFLFLRTMFLLVQSSYPVRIGVVPIWNDSEDIFMIKLFYLLYDTYGINAAFEYLSIIDSKTRIYKYTLYNSYRIISSKYSYSKNKKYLNIDEIMESKKLNQYVLKTKEWVLRLDIKNDNYIIVNGKFLDKRNWQYSILQIFPNDVDIIKKKIIKDSLTNDVDILDCLLEDAIFTRKFYIHSTNKLINSQKFVDLIQFQENFGFSSINENLNTEQSIWLIADFDTKKGIEFLRSALKYIIKHPYASLRFFHNPQLNNEGKSDHFSSFLFLLKERDIDVAQPTLNYARRIFNNYDSGDIVKEIEYPDFILDTYNSSQLVLNSLKAKSYWKKIGNLVNTFGFLPGEFGLLINGYIVGPMLEFDNFLFNDFEYLGNLFNLSIVSPLKGIVDQLSIRNSKKLKVFLPLLSSVILSYLAVEKYDDFGYSSQNKRGNLKDFYREFSPSFSYGDENDCLFNVKAILDPLNEISQKLVSILKVLKQMESVCLKVYLNPLREVSDLSINRFYRYVLHSSLKFDSNGNLIYPNAVFEKLPKSHLYTVDYDFLESWIVTQKESIYDLDNLLLQDLSSKDISKIRIVYELKHILIQGHAEDITLNNVPAGIQLALKTKNNSFVSDTIVMNNYGYFQFKANPGVFKIDMIKSHSDIFKISKISGKFGSNDNKFSKEIILDSFEGLTIFPKLLRNSGKENVSIFEAKVSDSDNFTSDTVSNITNSQQTDEFKPNSSVQKSHAEINIFSIASGHLYERFLYIMTLSVLKHTKHTVKFWFIENFLSSSFKNFLPYIANEFGFQYELITYRWPHWLRSQKEKQRQIWGYKILFLDVLFPLDLDNIIFIDADQIVRTDLKELVDMDLKGAPYGYTPMCDSREEMEGYRFWKKGYWKSYLNGKSYHISALYVVDLKRFREIAAGDLLRQHYQALSEDPASLANLDQDLPNNLQHLVPIFSLPQNWLWCETWCSDETLKDAKTIDLCNNPMTKESKLKRARRQIPEWNKYDKTIADLIARILEQRKTNESGECDVDNIAISVDMMQNIQFNYDEKNKKKDTHDEL